MKRRSIVELELDGKEYVIVPKADYLRLRRGDTPPNTVDAIEFARDSREGDSSRLSSREALGGIVGPSDARTTSTGSPSSTPTAMNADSQSIGLSSHGL